MNYFFDSSALAKRYHSELGTAVVDQIVQATGNQIRISRLTVVEMPSVFAIKVRARFISRDDASTLQRQFQEDIVSGRLEVFGLREEEFASAERLLQKHAFDLRLRALDALQLAVALGLKTQDLVESFVAAERVCVKLQFSKA